MIEVPSEGPATSRSIPSARSHSSHPHVKLLSERGQGASLASGIATLSNTNVGVAVLALPAAFANAGGIGGVLMLLAAGAAAIFSARLLSDCVDVVGRPATLASVAKAALGPCSIISDLAIIVGASGCAIGYLIVVGDTVPRVVGFTFGIYNSSIYILLSMLIVVPLAHLRRIDSLKYASLGIVFFFFSDPFVTCNPHFLFPLVTRHSLFSLFLSLQVRVFLCDCVLGVRDGAHGALRAPARGLWRRTEG